MTHAAFLDITGDTCPMTFVRVKLALEAMAPGDELVVRLNQGEPLENVPRSVVEEGHTLMGEAQRDGAAWRLVVRKG